MICEKKTPRCSTTCKYEKQNNEKLDKVAKKPSKKPPKGPEGNTITSGPGDIFDEEFFNIDNDNPNQFFKLNKKGEKRDWCFTLFPRWCDGKWHIPFKEFGEHKQVRYAIFGKEICPKTKKLHYQSYVYFHNNKSFNAVRKFLHNHFQVYCHFKKCRGSSKENISYCSKDNNFVEFGEEPKQGISSDLDDYFNKINIGEITSEEILIENPQMYHQYGRTFEKLEDSYRNKKCIKRDFETNGIWLCGKTGRGKSHIAFTENPNAFLYDPDGNRWWDGYEGNETVIINDFAGEIPFKQILKMVDKWEYKVPIRGKKKLNFCSKQVIITSSKLPHEIYNELKSQDGDLEQLYRRFKIYKLLNIKNITTKVEYTYPLNENNIDSDDDNDKIEFINGKYILKHENSNYFKKLLNKKSDLDYGI